MFCNKSQVYRVYVEYPVHGTLVRNTALSGASDASFSDGARESSILFLPIVGI